MKIDLKTVYDLDYPPFKECPYCGSEEFYIKQYAKGRINYCLRFDGEETDNGCMYEGLDYRNSSKFAYCCSCHEKLFRFEK